jgi:hypothetical protein
VVIYLSEQMAATGEVDYEGRWSIFGQAFQIIHKMPAKDLRQTDSLWKTYLAGEQAADAGGPYRESWTAIFTDLTKSYLPLLKRCPNGIHDAGMNRETYILNPDCAQSPTQLEMLVFLGKLMGHAIRAKHYQDLFLAPIVWKLIIGDQVCCDVLF